jgi:hypothetical protein
MKGMIKIEQWIQNWLSSSSSIIMLCTNYLSHDDVKKFGQVPLHIRVLNYCKSRLKNIKRFQYVFPCWFLLFAKSTSNHGAHELFVQINSKKGRCCQQAKNALGSLIHSFWNLNHVFHQSPYSLWKGKYSTHWYHCCPQIVRKTHIKSIMII